MNTPKNFQVGDRVLILRPAYVAGKVGVICGREDVQPKVRWLIQVESENIVVSLTPNEFQLLNQDKELL